MSTTHGTGEQRPDGQPSVQEIAESISLIIDAAERSAARIIDDAEAEAGAYMQEVRRKTDDDAARRLRALTELGDSLADQAEVLRREAERLADALGADPPGGRQQPDAPPEDPTTPRRRRRGQPAPGSEAVRMLAAQMAASGSDRQEIEARLRSGFGMDDSKEILDDLFDAGAPGRGKAARRWRRPWRTQTSG